MLGLLMVVVQIFPSGGEIALIAVVANPFMDIYHFEFFKMANDCGLGTPIKVF